MRTFYPCQMKSTKVQTLGAMCGATIHQPTQYIPVDRASYSQAGSSSTDVLNSNTVQHTHDRSVTLARAMKGSGPELRGKRACGGKDQVHARVYACTQLIYGLGHATWSATVWISPSRMTSF